MRKYFSRYDTRRIYHIEFAYRMFPSPDANKERCLQCLHKMP